MLSERKLPRFGCSITCVVEKGGDNLPAQIVDISGSGLAFIPDVSNTEISINQGERLNLKICMSEFSKYEHILACEIQTAWSDGLLVAAEISKIDEVNYKRWFLMIHKVIFGERDG
ncbi:TPA: PilZ domain-containing protein [Vibrio vulnificus]|uniref:PilZ domain-containing protein n=1 Tax=Vibrio vulnificus TaxID=672 RepID=A0A8H9N3K7_VIBVL|nr:PilZ domain-containing protein [Vibrio vulnificus]HAS8542163.1 PilZ domain-containing protein [Vibrio vulnificus]